MFKALVLVAVLGVAFYAYRKLAPKVKAEVAVVKADVSKVETKVAADVAAVKADLAAVERKF